MFEDSLVDSGGKLKTTSKYWMIGTAILNCCIVLVMIILPLLYPEALPKTAMTAMLTAPPPPPPPPPPAAPGRGRQADQDGLGDRRGSACTH